MKTIYIRDLSLLTKFQVKSLKEANFEVKKRPNWNPAIKVNLTITKCLNEAIAKAIQKYPVYINNKEFIICAIREKLDKLGIKYLIEEPLTGDKT